MKYPFDFFHLTSKQIFKFNIVIMSKYLLYFSLFIALNFQQSFVDCGIFSRSHSSTSTNSIQRDDKGIQSEEISFVEEFRDINTRLIGKTHSCDAELNMSTFEKIYQEDINQEKNQNYRYVKAKKLILDLKTLLNKSTCNAQGYDIAVDFYLSLDGKVFKRDINIDYCFSRLDKIFVYYLEKHAEICREVYIDTLKQKLEDMDEEKVKRVNFFAGNAINQLISRKRDENRAKSPGQRLMIVTNVHIDPRPKYILQRLKALVKGHKNEKALASFQDKKTSMMIVDRAKFGRLFNEYLVQPCKYYQDKLGPDVFEPVSFESVFHKVDERYPDFYKAWGRYRLCVIFNREADKKLQETIDQAILHPDD